MRKIPELPKVPLTVYISPLIKKRLSKAARFREISPSELARSIIMVWLERTQYPG